MTTTEHVHCVVSQRLLGLFGSLGAVGGKADDQRSGPTKTSAPWGKGRVIIQRRTAIGMGLATSTVMNLNDHPAGPAGDDACKGYLHNGMKRG